MKYKVEEELVAMSQDHLKVFHVLRPRVKVMIAAQGRHIEYVRTIAYFILCSMIALHTLGVLDVAVLPSQTRRTLKSFLFFQSVSRFSMGVS